MLSPLLNVSEIYYSKTCCESNLLGQAAHIQEHERISRLASNLLESILV
jgi:hypothetical protein